MKERFIWAQSEGLQPIFVGEGILAGSHDIWNQEAERDECLVLAQFSFLLQSSSLPHEWYYPHSK